MLAELEVSEGSNCLKIEKFYLRAWPGQGYLKTLECSRHKKRMPFLF